MSEEEVRDCAGLILALRKVPSERRIAALANICATWIDPEARRVIYHD